MIKAVDLTQIHSNPISFHGDENKAEKPNFDDNGDSVDLNKPEQLTDDETADSLKQAQEKLREQSDKYINSDKVHERVAGRALKFGADLLVIAAAFFVGKGGGRGGVQSLKELSKNKALKPIIDNVGKELKKPLKSVGNYIEKRAVDIIKGPMGDKLANKVVNSRFGKKVLEFMESRKATKGLADAVKETANGKSTGEKMEEIIADVSGASAATATAATVFGKNDDNSENNNTDKE